MEKEGGNNVLPPKLKEKGNRERARKTESTSDGSSLIPSSQSSYLTNASQDIADTQGFDDIDNSTVCIGSVEVNFVGLRYYDGIVSSGEMVGLVRQPNNQYDANAIQVVNTKGEQVGHIERSKALHLAPLVDHGLVKLEGNALLGSEKRYQIRGSVYIYSFPESNTVETINQRLRIGGMVLSNNQESREAREGSGLNQRRSTEKEEEEDISNLFETLNQADGKGQKMEPGVSIKSQLFDHQKEALAWLVLRENSLTLPPFWEIKRSLTVASKIMYTNVLTNYSTENRPMPLRGGIFADDMGLGKTLCLLSLIVTNKPGAVLPEIVKTERLEKATTVTEKQKTTSNSKLKNKKVPFISDNSTQEETLFEPPAAGGPRATLVVCPLSVLSNWTNQVNEHVQQSDISVYIYHGGDRIKDPNFLSQMDLVLTTYNVLSSEGCEAKDSAPLQQVDWLRIILDEGHSIKNPRSKMTKAAIALKGERRWVVTGTPIQNNVSDLYSLVAYLGIQPLKDKSFWTRTIQRPLNMRDPEGIHRLQALMSAIALRRTKDMQQDGKMIIELPPKKVTVQLVDFSDEERDLYGQWELEGQRLIGNLVENGTFSQNYSSILVVLLRLRQICDHSSLCPAKKFGDQLKDEKSSTASPELLEKLLSVLQTGGEDDCPICLSDMNPAVITRCAHIFCKRCIHRVLSKGKQTCPLCRAPVKQSDLIESPIEEIDATSIGDGTVSPSSKVKALLASLLDQKKEDPTVKSVVFSQFSSMLNMVQKPLESEGIRFVRLDGSMRAEEREKAMNSFKTKGPESPTVFLVSLRAAGVGVNLTSASRVYILDPWWNPAVEEQAMDRVHRLGQTRPVEVIRFAVANSIEERILELQEKKREVANCPFDKKSARKMNMEDVRLLMRL